MGVRAVGTSRIVLAVLVSALAALPARTQPANARGDAELRQQVERRFDVLPLHDGLALRPKSHSVRARAIEITSSAIAIDGQPVTGPELRDRLGADAELVLKLSYLDAETRRAMFAPPEPSRPPETPPSAAAPTPPAPPEEPLPPRPPRRHSTSDARVRIGGSITVARDETVTNDVVCIGGSADVQGRVEGNVVVIGGTATLGPEADVSGDVSVVGGTLNRDPAAHIGGRLNEVGIEGLEGLRSLHGLRYGPIGLLALSPMRHGIALVGTTMRLAIVCLLACIVVLLGGRYVERVGARAAAEPIKAGAVGLLAELLFFPLLVISAVVLIVTIIGIPLLVLIPVALLAAAILALVGFTSVAWTIGRAISTRVGWNVENVYLVAVVGVVTVIGPVLLARVTGLAGPLLFPITGMLLALGLLFEYCVWTIGIGALVLARFDRPRSATPAPTTPTTPAPNAA